MPLHLTSEVNGFKQSSLAFLRILACVTNTQANIANTMFKKQNAAGHDEIIFLKILQDFDSIFSAKFSSFQVWTENWVFVVNRDRFRESKCKVALKVKCVTSTDDSALFQNRKAEISLFWSGQRTINNVRHVSNLKIRFDTSLARKKSWKRNLSSFPCLHI